MEFLNSVVLTVNLSSEHIVDQCLNYRVSLATFLKNLVHVLLFVGV